MLKCQARIRTFGPSGKESKTEFGSSHLLLLFTFFFFSDCSRLTYFHLLFFENQSKVKVPIAYVTYSPAEFIYMTKSKYSTVVAHSGTYIEVMELHH